MDDFSVSGTDDPDVRGPKSFSDTSSNLFAPHLGYAMAVNDKLGLGVAVYAPWGLELNGIKVSDVTCEIDHPEPIQFGLRYVPLPYKKISLELDFVWTNWSIIDNQSVYMKQPFAIEPVPGVFTEISEMSYRRDWKDTRQIRIGVEWQANDWLTLRGGYFYDPSPIPDTTWDIMWADADKKTIPWAWG